MRKRSYKGTHRKMNNSTNIAIAIIIAVIMVVLVAVFLGYKEKNATPAVTPTPVPTQTPVATGSPQGVAGEELINNEMENFTKAAQNPTISNKMQIEFNQSLTSVNVTQKISYINNNENAIPDIALRYFPNSLTDKAALPISDTAAFKDAATPAEITNVLVNGQTAKKVASNASWKNDGTVAVQNPEWLIEGKYSTTLRVKFMQPLNVDDKVEITLAYSQNIPDATYRLGRSRGAAQLSWFYFTPAIYDSSANDGKGSWDITNIIKNGYPWEILKASYQAVVTLPEAAVLTSTGVVTDTQTEGNLMRHYIAASNARDFSLAVSLGKKEQKLQVEEASIRAYAGTAEKCKLITTFAKSILATYSTMLTPYSGELDIMQCVLKQPSATQEGLILIDASTVTGKEIELEYTLAVALARLTTGVDITCEGNFNEILANYFALRHLESSRGTEEVKQMADKSKGAQTLMQLRTDMGAIEFDNAVNKYLSECAGQVGDVNVFINAFEQSSKVKTAISSHI